MLKTTNKQLAKKFDTTQEAFEYCSTESSVKAYRISMEDTQCFIAVLYSKNGKSFYAI